MNEMTVPSVAPMSPDNAPRHGGARDAFVYLVSFFLLYLIVPAIGTIIFQLINIGFPDPTLSSILEEFYTRYVQIALRWSLATLLIGVPLYFASMWWIHYQLARGTMNPRSGVRRWLTYISLFLGASTVIIDLVMVVNRFLGGELGSRFLLKALTILVLAGYIFAYYLWDIRREDYRSGSPTAVILGGVAILAIVTTIIVGFLFSAGPGTARKQNFDTQRVSALESLTNAVEKFAVSENRLPSALDEAVKSRGVFLEADNLKDPETEAPYEYRMTSPNTFELCAIFSLSNVGDKLPSYQAKWKHGAGRVCFSEEVQSVSDAPLFVPPVPPIPPVPAR